jgi:hypothetical protein
VGTPSASPAAQFLVAGTMFAADLAATQLALLFSIWTRMVLRPVLAFEITGTMRFEMAVCCCRSWARCWASTRATG